MFPQGYVNPKDAKAVNVISGAVTGGTYNPYVPVAPLPANNAAQTNNTNTATSRTSGSRSSGSGGSGGGVSAADLAFLDDQANQIRSLLGRTQTNLDQGLTNNNDQYNEQVGTSTQSRDAQNIDQNKEKLAAYGTINRNAGQGYRSLAQIIGRAAGTGSSAFREALPDVIGKDTSSKRFNATGTYDTNIGKIEASFQNVLADLMKQKKKNESSLRSGVETQRQDLNSKLAQNAAQRAQALGGGYEQVKAAQAPYQQAIEQSRNSVENFFNQFRTEYTPQAVAAQVNPYNTDRAAINARSQGQVDSSNPYAVLLKKKQQGAL